MKKRLKKGISLILFFLILFAGIPVHAEEIKISDKEYLVSLQDANAIYISNEKAVSTEVGTKMFLTYTVEKVTKDTAIQSGVCGTDDHDADYPYVKNGRMNCASESILFEEGYTYVYRFERTKSGFAYDCAKLKDEEAINITFPTTVKRGDGSNFQYYGVWVDGRRDSGVSAILNHVRCYDENGNDLGVHFNRPTGVIQNEINKLLDVHLTINTSYSFSLKDTNTIAVMNKYPTDSQVIYFEYEVDGVTQDKTTQQGVVVSRAPKTNYPHGSSNGQMTYKTYKQDDTDKPLLKNGAKYCICFIKGEDGYNAIIQRTIKGVTENIAFSGVNGKYNPDNNFVGIWFGDGGDDKFTANFKNVKCYDDKGNNLGIQLNRGSTTISLHGESEDYSKSEAVYYCKNTSSFLILDEGKIATKQVGDQKEAGSYKIVDKENLYLNFKDGKETYKYTSHIITDDAQNQYVRMRDSKVQFVTGAETMEAKAEAATGYRVSQPEDPIKENNTFVGWYLGDGTAFDFDTVVTESITLYAKWQDGDGHEYLAVDQAERISFNRPMITAIAVSAVVLALGAVGCIVIMKRRKKDGK